MGNRAKARERRGAGDKKKKAGTEVTGEVICGGEREERGGGVLTEFELIRQQNLSAVRFCAVSSSNVCVCVCVTM